jgi:hypothetical protein
MQPLHCLTCAFRSSLEQILGQEREVVEPRPQRRHLHAKRREPIVKIRAKSSCADGLLDRPVRRRHHPDRDLARLRRTHRTHLALLESAEQLGLNGSRELAHFVEKEHATVCSFEQSGPTIRRAGKAPLLVSKELAVDECLGETGAVESDEGLVRPQAQRVKLAGC